MFKTFASSKAAHRFALRAFALGLACAAAAPLARGADMDSGRFSPRGFKGSLAIGSFDPSSTQDLDEGVSSTLRIGYGVNDRVTLWTALVGSEHHRERRDEDGDRVLARVGGVELSAQYAIPMASRLQPFGRIGVGLYSIEDDDTEDAWAGGGLTFGVAPTTSSPRIGRSARR